MTRFIAQVYYGFEIEAENKTQAEELARKHFENESFAGNIKVDDFSIEIQKD